MPIEGITISPYFKGGYHKISVTSTGTGNAKIYHILQETYDVNGNLIGTYTNDFPLVPYIGPSIDINTVRITTPIDVTYVQANPYDPTGISGRDGFAGLCANCTKLEEFDFTTDITNTNTYSNGKGNVFQYTFLNCESLKTINIGDFWSNSFQVDPSNPTQYDNYYIAQAGNHSLCCFMNCKNLETITGVFNFADDENDWDSQNPSNNSPGWTRLSSSAENMFYGCAKLTGVQIHLAGNSSSFISDKVYERLGLKLNQFTLV